MGKIRNNVEKMERYRLTKKTNISLEFSFVESKRDR